MATGTGKTVVAGLDYRRLREAGAVDSILFVAHREEILGQSLNLFRHIMRSGSFGERFVAGERPAVWRHVFASVQSLARLDLERDLPRDHFDMVVVDEFHHASAETKTYANLLHHVRPNLLLGLTATPERADGLDVRVWFDGRIAVELRLWEALERGLLAPFQHFGLHDQTDLHAVRWKRGTGYDPTALTNVYTGHDARLRIIVQALLDKVTDVGRMRALGFCVSIEHAEFMTKKFNDAGIPALAVTSATAPAERRSSLEALRNRDVNILFTSLFGHGDVFGVAAEVEPERGDHPVARLEVGHSSPHRLDLPGHLEAEDGPLWLANAESQPHRQPQSARDPQRPHRGVAGVDRRRKGPDQHLAIRRLGLRHLPNLHDLRRPAPGCPAPSPRSL